MEGESENDGIPNVCNQTPMPQLSKQMRNACLSGDGCTVCARCVPLPPIPPMYIIAQLLPGRQSSILSSNEWHNDMNPAFISAVMAPNLKIKEITAGTRWSPTERGRSIAPTGKGSVHIPNRKGAMRKAWIRWERVHAAHTVCTIWGNYTAFTPQIGPSHKGTRQQHWHQENSQEMGITSVSCSLNLMWIVHIKMIDVQQLFIKFPGVPCQVQIWKTLWGMGMGSECGTRGGGVQQYHESPPSH